MFVYCAKCGHIEKQAQSTHCKVCEIELQKVPAKYLTASGNLFLSQDVRTCFIQEVIETGCMYDPNLAKQHDNIIQQQVHNHEETVAQKVRDYNASMPVHRCPVCGSTKLSAISTVGKIAKISFLGVWGAGDLGKKRYCNSCGHKF